MTTRSYRMRERASKVDGTRERILGAAASIVARKGIGSLTIEDVARAAGVARLTVYNHFESKRGLLEALAWRTFARADIGRVRAARTDPDPERALHRFVSENAAFLASLGDEGRRYLDAALADPDVRAVVESTYVNARRGAVTALVQRLVGAGRLGAAFTADGAVAAVMVLTSLESFETLTRVMGRTAEEAGSLLADMAAQTLLAR